MRLARILFGRPLATSEEAHQKVGVVQGVPMLGLDGLASAAYGPEAALAMLLPLGAAGLTYALPVTGVIVACLVILYFSYRQTQAAYPGGGGSYTVAKENLGQNASLLAAASLLLDYVLVVAVGISAGVGALVSVLPRLHSQILPLCLAVLAIVTFVNLRGVRESATVFAVPTYGFVVLMVVTLVWGIAQSITAGGNPTPVAPVPPTLPTTASVSVWLLLRSFANGCTAMTGVEAVSNGMMAFKEPRVKNAQWTLTVIVAVLVVLLLGIAYLAKVYGLSAMPTEASGYQSVLSQLVGAVAGRGWFYYATMAFVLAVLALSAQTGFADFPRLCRLLATDGFLPHTFAGRGRRLVYSTGIIVLALMTAALLIAFQGLTERLIPLFAVGAFTAFTVSQAGMIVHWRKNQERGSRLKLAVNAVGFACTAVALTVIIIAKFSEGAWVVAFLIPLFFLVFRGVHSHYRKVRVETRWNRPINPVADRPPLVVVPFQRWSSITERALRFALRLGSDVTAIHVEQDPEEVKQLKEDWMRFVEEPLSHADLPDPCLVILASPYRHVIGPILEYIKETRLVMPNREIAVIIPELVESKWWHHLLHNQRAMALKAALLFSGDNRMMVVNIPWYAK